MNLQDVFFNQAGRLRSGWRFLIFMLAFVFFGGLIGSAVIFFLSRQPVEVGANSILFIIVNSAISLSLSIILGWLCGKYLEDLPFRALGAAFVENWFKHFLWGLLIGAVTLLFAALIGILFGGLSFRLNESQGSSAIFLTLGISFLIFTLAAMFEEAFFRGYILQTFLRSDSAWVGVILTSLMFASVHNTNPGANLLSFFNTFIGGIWLAVAYLKTRDLWMPFGVHLSWNWVQGSIMGINVSGIQDFATAPVFQASDLGPAWLTGGNYGVEGGIISTIALIASTALIWYLPYLKPLEEMLVLTNSEKPAARELES